MSNFLSLISRRNSLSFSNKLKKNYLIKNGREFSSIKNENDYLYRVADESMLSPEILKELNKGKKANKKLLEPASLSDLPQLEEKPKIEPVITEAEDSAESTQFYNRLKAMGIKTPSSYSNDTEDESNLLFNAVESMFGKAQTKDCLTCSLSKSPIYPGLTWNWRLSQETWLQEFLAGQLGELSPIEINRKTPKWMSSGDRASAAAYEFRPIGFELDEMPESVEVSKKLKTILVEPRKYTKASLPGYAHFLYRGRYASICRVLSEVKEISFKDKENLRILDLGMGPGLGLAAIHKVFGPSSTSSSSNKINSYTGFSNQQIFREETERLSIILSQSETNKSLPYNINIKSKIQDILNSSLENVTKSLRKQDDVIQKISKNKNKNISKMSENGRYDLIVLPYLFTDLGNDDEVRFRYLQLAYELLDDNGHIVIVDEGGPYGSYFVRWSREVLLKLNISNGNNYNVHLKSLLPGGFSMDNIDLYEDLKGSFLLPPLGATSIDDYKRSSEELQVVAPCTHDETCPKAVGDWCSFSHRYPSGKQNYQSEEKYSYVTLMKYDKKKVSFFYIIYYNFNFYSYTFFLSSLLI